MSVTQPTHDEHQELLPQVEALRVAAEVIDGDGDKVLTALDDALEFLHHHLIPHAQADDAVLYPRVEQVMRAPGATATMRRDHVEVTALTQQLQQLRDGLGASPTADERRGLQRVLYGLYAVVHLHFAKEEEIYLPLLDAGLTPDDAADMFDAMHKAAAGPLATTRPAGEAGTTRGTSAV